MQESKTTPDETYEQRRTRENLFKRFAYDMMREKVMQALRFREPSVYAWNEQVEIVERVYQDLVKNLPEYNHAR